MVKLSWILVSPLVIQQLNKVAMRSKVLQFSGPQFSCPLSECLIPGGEGPYGNCQDLAAAE